MTKFKKTIASFAGFAIALSMLAVVAAPVASAATIDELLAQISSLTAQLNALKGGSATVSFTFTRNLTVGSSGADVSALQNWLISKGYSIPAGATGYFGVQTKAALAAYQAAKGIVPAAGYFGPITMAKVSSEMAVVAAPGGSPSNPSTGLAGTDGSIEDVSRISTFNDEEIGEGESAVKVLGFEVQASNDGDIALKSLRLSFDPAGNASGDSDHLDDYIDSVTVWQGDKKVGSADVDDFNEDDNDVFTKTITLSNSVVRADDTEKFYVSVDAAGNLDSGDIDSDSWSVDVDSIRFEDGSGVVTTDDSTGDIDAMNVGMNFVTFSTSADTELKISTASDSPEAGVVIADDNENTDNVSLLKGKLKLEGESDVTVDEFPVTFTVTGTAGNVSSTTGSVTLKIGDEEYTESVPVSSSGTTATITFDDLGFDIEAGDTVNFEVLADINDFDSVFVAGDTLKASVTASNRDMMDVENEEGDQLDNTSEKSGVATGEAQTFRTSGLQVTLVSTNTDATQGTSSNDDVGLFTIRYKVKAIGDSVYVSSLADATTGALTSGKTSVTVDKAGTATTAASMSVALTNVTDTDLTSVGNYLIEEGDEETFEVTVAVPLGAGGTSGQYRAKLSGISFSTSDIYPVPTAYTTNLDEFKTSYKVLN